LFNARQIFVPASARRDSNDVRFGKMPKPSQLLENHVLEGKCVCVAQVAGRSPELRRNLQDSVTILCSLRSSSSTFDGNFESSQIREGVARSALARLCAVQLWLCSRRRFIRRFFAASVASWWWWWRTLWTGTRRNIRSVESFRLAIPGAGTVITTPSNKFQRPLL